MPLSARPNVILASAAGYRLGRKMLVRTDSSGGTHEFIGYCHQRRLQYPIGFTLTDEITRIFSLGNTSACRITARNDSGDLQHHNDSKPIGINFGTYILHVFCTPTNRAVQKRSDLRVLCGPGWALLETG